MATAFYHDDKSCLGTVDCPSQGMLACPSAVTCYQNFLNFKFPATKLPTVTYNQGKNFPFSYKVISKPTCSEKNDFEMD